MLTYYTCHYGVYTLNIITATHMENWGMRVYMFFSRYKYFWYSYYLLALTAKYPEADIYPIAKSLLAEYIKLLKKIKYIFININNYFI